MKENVTHCHFNDLIRVAVLVIIVLLSTSSFLIRETPSIARSMLRVKM